MPATNLRCDHQAQPLGLADLHPYLSWLPPRRSRTAAVQLQWQGDLQGESGWLGGDFPGLVWPGPELKPQQRLQWRLRLRGESGRVGGWSSWAAFETGPDPAAWPAEWCSPASSEGAPLLRYQIPSEVEGWQYLRCAFAALGVPRLRLRGDDLLPPGWADYQQDPRFRVEFHVLALPLSEAAGADLSIELGGGFHERHGHGRRGLSCWLYGADADGAPRRLAVTAAEWQWRPGPMRRDDPYDGVLRDAKRASVDQLLAAETGWTVAEAVSPPAGRLVAAVQAPPQELPEQRPQRRRRLHSSAHLLDFGCQVVGGLRLDGRWPRGAVVQLRFGEEATAGGLLLTRTNRNAACTDRFVVGSDGRVDARPYFSSRGFRYCEIQCHREALEGPRAVAVSAHDAAAARATFACSDRQVTRLFAACLRTFRQNQVGLLRDCPQRDERIGWLGDAAMVMPAVALCTDSAAMLRRWSGLIDDLYDPQRQLRTAPMAPAVGVFLGQRQSDRPLPRSQLPAGDNAYTAAATLLVQTYGQQTGDLRLARDLWPHLYENLQSWCRRPDWPLLDASQHGDHSALPAGRAPAKTPPALVSGAMLLHEMRAGLCLARQLEVDAGSLPAAAETLATALRDRYRSAFVDPASSQGTLTIGLWQGLSPDRQASLAALRQRIATEDGAVGTGIILTGPLLQVLARNAASDLAWQLVSRRRPPGWLWMLADGDATLHENLVPDYDFVSRNQPALGVVAEYLLSDCLGLRPDPLSPDPCPRTWILHPPACGPSWAEGSLPSVWGPIRVRWQRRGPGLTYSVDAPASVQVRIELPASQETQPVGPEAP